MPKLARPAAGLGVSVLNRLKIVEPRIGHVVLRQPLGEHESLRLRLISANPDYAPYDRLAQDVHVIGAVLWMVRRA